MPEPLPPVPDLAAVADDAPRPPTRLMVGAPLPAVLDLKELGAVLGLSPTRIWRLYEAGEFDFARLTPTVGNRPRFSGRKVQAWVDGENVTAPPIRSFAKGTRR